MTTLDEHARHIRRLLGADADDTSIVVSPIDPCLVCGLNRWDRSTHDEQGQCLPATLAAMERLAAMTPAEIEAAAMEALRRLQWRR